MSVLGFIATIIGFGVVIFETIIIVYKPNFFKKASKKGATEVPSKNIVQEPKNEDKPESAPAVQIIPGMDDVIKAANEVMGIKVQEINEGDK